jgi:hypothetical protein
MTLPIPCQLTYVLSVFVLLFGQVECFSQGNLFVTVHGVKRCKFRALSTVADELWVIFTPFSDFELRKFWKMAL